MEKVVLVDLKGNALGTEEKLKAHEGGGKLHRAFSVFIFNSKGLMLLQQRAESKYHCAGLWTNTCCSHPRPGEDVEKAAHRRLMEEMGFDCPLKKAFDFVYRAEFDNGLTEHEFDHVFIGTFDGEPKPDPEEAGGWKWISVKGLQADIKASPEKYTPWFKIAIPRLAEYLDK